jgi:hypothetical protein
MRDGDTTRRITESSQRQNDFLDSYERAVSAYLEELVEAQRRLIADRPLVDVTERDAPRIEPARHACG